MTVTLNTQRKHLYTGAMCDHMTPAVQQPILRKQENTI
jgi:hypothetical protein